MHTIAPTSALPDVTEAVTIDGYSQPGSSANTNPVGQGLNTVLKIEIDCTVEGGVSGCLRVTGDDVVIRGLALNRSIAGHVRTSGAALNLVLEGCFIGTNPDGTQAMPAAASGVGVYVGASHVQPPQLGCPHDHDHVGSPPGRRPIAAPPCTGVFADVACPSRFADWIEALAAEQITGGCGGPGSNNTRGQMAVFITKGFILQ